MILAQQERLLAAHGDEVRVVATARDGARALQAVASHRPDVVLLDLGLPDVDGLEVIREIKSRWPGTEILVYTVFADEQRVLDAVRAGASGYLLKGAAVARVVEALREVCSGGSVVQPQLARALLRRLQPAPDAAGRLTPREIEVLSLIAKGLSNRAVAEQLGVSRATVRTHLEHIYAKLVVSNRTEAVTLAIREGLIDP